jgi:hypothetical protein
MRKVLVSLLLCGSATLAGCATRGLDITPASLVEQADQFNVAAADAERLMIVRNVMRARDRTSMIFTRIDSFTGSNQSSISGTAGFAIAEGGNNDGLGPSLTVGREASPAFNVSVLNDQKFHRAIQSSIDLSIYESLLNAGWRPNLLHTLFIERVEENGRTFDNDPSEPADFAAFQSWLNQGRDRSLQVCAKSNPDALSTPLTTISDLQGIAAIAEQDLEIEEDEDRPRTYRVVRPSTSRWLAFDCTADNTPQTIGQSLLGERGAGATETSAGTVAGTSSDGIYVRSVEGVLFFLGELVRAQTPDAPVRISVDRGAPPQPIFVVAPGARPNGLVFRHEDGRTYHVPYPNPQARGGDIDRTHQVITLMLQLIGMLQEREDVPVTQTVRVLP